MASFLRSFVYAAQGLKLAVLEERNFRFHLCAGFYVFLFSFFYPFGPLEYCLLAILVGGVMALELLNSALERTVANPKPHRYELAGAVKDMAAGAVLVFSIAAAVCGVFLFWNTAVFLDIFRFFVGHLFLLVLLLLSLALAVWFIFYFPPKKITQKGTNTLE